MATTREEIWGRITYDAALDEFEGELCGNPTPLSLDRPISVGCLVTGRCNLHCEFCYGNDEALPTNELSTDEWQAIFQRLSSWGIMRVDLSGGEPTVRKDLPIIANAAMSEGLNVILSTNGTLLSAIGPISLPKSVRIHVSVDSGFAEIHEKSRLLRSLKPSYESFMKTAEFIRRSVQHGYKVRVLTCIGRHNLDGLFELGEFVASMGVIEWNISRILVAGRAQVARERWAAEDEPLLEQITNIRETFPWIRIRYSNRTEQDGYFLLVLPDGSLATQFTDGRDKVVLGKVMEMSLDELRSHPDFNLVRHGRKWLASIVECQDLFCQNTRHNYAGVNFPTPSDPAPPFHVSA